MNLIPSSILRISTLLFMAYITLCNEAVAQVKETLCKAEYSYRRYTSHDGLHHIMLDNLFQDRQGFIWIGTYKGFTRFDGFSFTSFLAETMENILRIEDADDGVVRAFSQNCCYVVNRNNLLRKIVLTDSLFFNSYNSSLLPHDYLVYESPSSNNKYLMRLQNDSLREVLRLPESNLIRNNRLWMDTITNRLYIPSGKFLMVHDMQKAVTIHINNGSIETFMPHSRLGLLAIGSEGIYKVKETTLEQIIPYHFPMLNKQMLETAEGDIIIRDFLSLYRFRDGKIEVLRHNSDLPMWDMLLDREDNLWVATGNGLYNFFRFDFKNFYFDGHAIKSIVQDTGGNHWLAGLNEELFQLSQEKVKLIDYPTLPGLTTTSFGYGSAAIGQKLYFPRRNGILVRDGQRFGWADVPLAYNYKRIIPYGNGTAIAAFEAVLITGNDGKTIKRFTVNELGQDNIYDIAVDSHGRLVACGEKGLSIISDNVKLVSGANTTTSYVMTADMHGRIWSASGNQLNLLTEGDSVTTVFRFPQNIIVGLLDVGKDHLLIAMLRGFYLFDLKEYFAKGTIEMPYYDHNNGMIGLEPVINALHKDRDGRVWMPTTECTVTFEPLKLLRGQQPPNLVVQNCEFSQDNVHWKQFPEQSSEIGKTYFRHTCRNFRFSYIGLNYSAGANVRYSYRLKGFQEEWSVPRPGREAIFNNLPPGQYTFELYADAGTDNTRSAVQSICFTIHPAFWQQVWFIVLSLLLIIVASAGIAIVYQRHRMRRQMEQLETEKTLNDLRIRSIRLKAIPHFNSNVLSAIEYFVMTKPKEEANRLLNIYSKFTGLTLREVDKASRSLKDEIEYVTLYLKLEKLRFGNKFDYRIEIEQEVDQRIQLPNMMLHTYAENAVKHGFSNIREGGLLTITVRHSGAYAEVNIEDNGIGRTAAAKRNTPGSKQGLEILSRQIEIYNGVNEKKIRQTITDLFHEDGSPAGTCFTVEVPYTFTYV